MKPGYLDHSKIHRLVKPDPQNPCYALIQRAGDNWYMVYYGANLKTAQVSLQTENLEIAKARRDDLYRRAKAAGRGVVGSRMEHHAQRILNDPEESHGLRFLVFFDGQRGVFDTLKEAKEFRKELALKILERKGLTAGAAESALRIRRRERSRGIVTSADFRKQKKMAEL